MGSTTGANACNLPPATAATALAPASDAAAEIVVARYAVPPVNPTTGEAWADDVPVPDRAAPIAYVTAPSIEASVKPRPVLS